MNVIVINWIQRDFKSHTPNSLGIYNNCKFIPENKYNDEPYNAAIIIGYPHKDLKLQYPKENTILITQEPPTDRYRWINKSFKDFCHVLTLYNSKLKNVHNTYPLLPWLIDESYDKLISIDPYKLTKNNKISWITSNKMFSNGHKNRLEFKNYLDKTNFDYDLFGRGFNEIYNKSEGL